MIQTKTEPIPPKLVLFFSNDINSFVKTSAIQSNLCLNMVKPETGTRNEYRLTKKQTKLFFEFAMFRCVKIQMNTHIYCERRSYHQNSYDGLFVVPNEKKTQHELFR